MVKSIIDIPAIGSRCGGRIETGDRQNYRRKPGSSRWSYGRSQRAAKPDRLCFSSNAAVCRKPNEYPDEHSSWGRFLLFFLRDHTTRPPHHQILHGHGLLCRGVPQLIEKAKQILGVDPGETTPDGEFTLELCRCVGACSQAPVIVIDEESYGRVRPNKLPQIIRSVQTQKEAAS
jgi:(2Fe-2S) ferredoxin